MISGLLFCADLCGSSITAALHQWGDFFEVYMSLECRFFSKYQPRFKSRLFKRPFSINNVSFILQCKSHHPLAKT